MVSAPVARRVATLIESRGLHIALPVPIKLAAEIDGWDVLYRGGIAPLMGVAVVTAHDRIMMINEDLTEAWRRYAIAHEMAHVLAGDEGSMFMLKESFWGFNKAEIRADRIAATLLIPRHVLYDAKTFDAVATACVVPLFLVKLRWEMLCSQGEAAV